MSTKTASRSSSDPFPDTDYPDDVSEPALSTDCDAWTDPDVDYSKEDFDEDGFDDPSRDGPEPDVFPESLFNDEPRKKPSTKGLGHGDS